MNSFRIFLIGGLTSYRALFSWLTPWILVPSFLLGPIFQILFFAYVGRSVNVADDSYFLIGNALLYAAIPCLFAMGATIGGERQQGTLPLLLASPAARVPLFVGRALPVIVNGFVVSLAALSVGAVVLQVAIPVATWLPIAVAVAVSAYSCTGLGLAAAALALRVRETAVLSNVIFGVLLIFSGVNVPLAVLPSWMAAVSRWMPLTHSIGAARQLAAGSGLGAVRSDLLIEVGIGTACIVVGVGMLAFFERESRRLATLDAA